MEGMPHWLLPAVMAIFGLMWLSVVPALVALGFLLARRPRPALILFSITLLCEAILGAAFYCVVSLKFDLPTALAGASLLLAGVGQFIAALRGPRTYAVALPFGVSAVLVIVVGVRSAEHSGLPGWTGPPLIVTSLILAAAGVIVAVASRVRVPLPADDFLGGDPNNGPAKRSQGTH